MLLTDNSKTVKPIIEKLLEMDKEHPDCDFKKICQFVGEFIFTVRNHFINKINYQNDP